MFGQTNCWLHPTIEYIAYVVNISGAEEVYISTKRAARNMSYQGFTAENGKVSILAHIKGEVILYHTTLILSPKFT